MSHYDNLKQQAADNLAEFSKKVGHEINPDTFCLLPFIHISTMPHGEIKLCCRGQPPAGGTSKDNPHVQDPNFSLKEYWESDYMNDIRDKLLTGKRVAQCKNCWKMEDKDILSLRHNRMIDYGYDPRESYVENVKQYMDTGKIPFNVPLLELKLTNLCNFKCRMCWPKDSSLWWQDWDKVEKYYDDDTKSYIRKTREIVGGKNMSNVYQTNANFVDDLLHLMENVEEIEFAGGEPILDPIHFNILDSVKYPERVTLKYSTNLSTLVLNKKFDIIGMWKKFKDIKLTISIDGNKDTNHIIRRGADWETLKQNVEIVRRELDNIAFMKGSTCISAHNALTLDKTAEAIIMELGIKWHTSRLQYPDFQHANIHKPEELQQSVDRLNITKQKLKEFGATKFDMLHVDNSINWLLDCIKNNAYGEKSQRFLDFNKTIDGLDVK